MGNETSSPASELTLESDKGIIDGIMEDMVRLGDEVRSWFTESDELPNRESSVIEADLEWRTASPAENSSTTRHPISLRERRHSLESGRARPSREARRQREHTSTSPITGAGRRRGAGVAGRHRELGSRTVRQVYLDRRRRMLASPMRAPDAQAAASPHPRPSAVHAIRLPRGTPIETPNQAVHDNVTPSTGSEDGSPRARRPWVTPVTAASRRPPLGPRPTVATAPTRMATAVPAAVDLEAVVVGSGAAESPAAPALMTPICVRPPPTCPLSDSDAEAMASLCAALEAGSHSEPGWVSMSSGTVLRGRARYQLYMKALEAPRSAGSDSTHIVWDVVCTLDMPFPAADVFNVLVDFEMYPKWDNMWSHVAKLGTTRAPPAAGGYELETFHFSSRKLPFPLGMMVRQREFVVVRRCLRERARFVMMMCDASKFSNALPDPMPDHIRGVLVGIGGFVVYPSAAGCRVVAKQAVDPRGAVPSKLVAFIAKRGPPEFIGSLGSVLERRKR